MKIILILVSCIVILLSSCSPKIIQPAIIEKTIVRDSIVEKLRDTTITIPADSSWLKALLECDSLGNVQLKQLLEYQAGKNQKPPAVVIENNVLTALSYTDSLNIYLALKDRYQYSQTDNAKYEKEVVEVNKLTWWQNSWITIGKICAGAVLLFIGFGVFKLYKILKK